MCNLDIDVVFISSVGQFGRNPFCPIAPLWAPLLDLCVVHKGDQRVTPSSRRLLSHLCNDSKPQIRMQCHPAICLVTTCHPLKTSVMTCLWSSSTKGLVQMRKFPCLRAHTFLLSLGEDEVLGGFLRTKSD